MKHPLPWLVCATLFATHPVLAAPPATDSPVAMTRQTTGFTLRDAITKALLQSPRLKAYGSSVAAAKGALRQAGAWANPAVDVQAENFSGSGTYKGFDSAEINYGITQQVLIGGKLSAQKAIAGHGLEIASLEEKATALDVIRDVSVAFADTVAAEEKVRLASEQKVLAEDVLKSVSVRVGAAAAPLIQKSRAEVERSTAIIALDKARRDRDTTRKNLAVLMGEERFALPLDRSRFYTLHTPASAPVDAAMSANPDIVKRNSDLERSKAQLDLEKANAIPDPSVSIGVRDLRDTGDRAFMMGLSLPIPIFDANRGNIERARNEVNRTEQDNREFSLNTSAELTAVHERLQNAYMQAETLRTEILPSAENAFRLAREGYGVGRFPYLEVLDAQRSLFSVKQQQIDAIREYHVAQAQLERLTAMHMDDISKDNKGAGHVE